MRSSALRVGVVWILGAVMAAPAWGSCASALAVLGTPTVCPMRAVRHCPAPGPGASAACCLIDQRMPASNVPASVAPPPVLELAPALAPAIVAFDSAGASHRAAFVESRAPLRGAGLPTYLRISVLLI